MTDTTSPARDTARPERRLLANAVRFLSIDAVQQANSGHPGMPMGMADIAEVLWNDCCGTTRPTPAGPTGTVSWCPTVMDPCCCTRCCT
jgi:transketolase